MYIHIVDNATPKLLTEVTNAAILAACTVAKLIAPRQSLLQTVADDSEDARGLGSN
jgi:hypothetical protein